MAGRFKNWWDDLWSDDDYYEDESSFDDDIWADLGIDPGSDPDTWFDETPTDDPYGIGSFFDDTYNFGDWGGDDDSWDPPTGTVNPWEVEDADPYGIGSYFDTYDFGDWGAPAEDFEDPDFNWGEFDVDAYLDSILDPDYGGGTEGDPSDWFINSGDPYNIGETYTEGSDEWDKIMAELSDYDPNIVGGSSGYAGGGGSPYVDPSTFDTSIFDELGYDPSTGSIEDWLQSIIPSTEVDPWEEESGPFGGGFGPWLRDFFLGKGGLEGKEEGEGIGGLFGFLGSLFGKANTAVDTVGSGIGSLFDSKLGQLALLNYMRNKKESDIHVPVGYGNGGGGGDGSPIDYRVFNLQPALMPGVAYANVGKPEGMKYGGSVYPSVNPALPRPPFDPRRHWTPPQPKKQRGYGQAQEGRGGMKDGGLGDVTLAKLEPGEFVVTKKAVDNIGAQNLYKMMKQAEGRG